MLKKIKILIVIAISCSCVTVIWFQQKKLSAVEAQSQAPVLTYEVSALQNSYVLREPIPLKFKISNQTSVPIKFDGFYGLGVNVKLLVRDEDAKENVYELSKYYRDGLTGFHEMLPNKQFEYESLLDGELSEVVFPKPGQYEVKAEYSYNTGIERKQPVKILSNSFIVNISEPKGVDKLAYNYLKGTFETALKKNDKTPLKQLWQYFVDNFGNSVYGKYMIVELAQIYEGAEDAKALRELCKIYTLDFFYSKDVKKRLLKINTRLHPIVLNLNAPPDAPLPQVFHPCTGKPIDPMNF